MDFYWTEALRVITVILALELYEVFYLKSGTNIPHAAVTQLPDTWTQTFNTPVSTSWTTTYFPDGSDFDSLTMASHGSHFKVIQNFKADYTSAEFTQYESQRTGMRVVVVNAKGPKIYGYFAVATEIHDDSGAPHTLEHLVFMGSRKYPYKGVLDKVATRVYSDTNAWTDTAETVYTLTTAGWEGFAEILPIYLDHVIVPTLTDAACYTEVHHIDGEGNDAGVVYSEMQGRENLQDDLMELQMRRLLYPDEDGFRYETGGMTKALRVLTADRIREFHKDMYQPKNIRLILIGEVDRPQLLDILDKFEGEILDRVPPFEAPFRRPWVDSRHTPPLSKTVVDIVEFPEEDESTGEIQIGFIGPESTNDLLETALYTLLSYLAGSEASVLVNTLVEKEQLCSAVYGYLKSHYHSVIVIDITAVATEKLESVEKRFFEVLREHAAGPLDMVYLNDCLARFRRQCRWAAEENSDHFKDTIIKDHNFGARDGSDLKSLADFKSFDDLEGWTEQQWKDLLKKWISDAHHVSILGKPSIKLGEKIKSEEIARLAEQKKQLGEKGLKERARKLEEAQAQNGKPIPEWMIRDLKVPSPDSIHFFPTTSARSGLAKQKAADEDRIQKIVDQDENGLPLFIHFEHIETSFVQFGVIVGTTSVPVELKPLLGIYLTNFFATPIDDNGNRIEFEDVVVSLEKDTISFSAQWGSEVGSSESVYIHFSISADKYETAVKWLSTMLVKSIFDKDRVVAGVAKLLADVPDEKRDGNAMAWVIDRMIHLAPQSSVRANLVLVRAIYLKRLKALLKTDPDRVLKMLESLRSSLLTFDNLRVLTMANLDTLPHPVSAFKPLLDAIPAGPRDKMQPIVNRKTLLSDAGQNPGSAAYIVPLPIDSSFATFATKSIDSYTSPALPAFMVALAYLSAVEGPMWETVRGTGLAYGVHFARDIEAGLLRFVIYKSPNAFAAYNKARQVVKEYVDGTKDFDELALEGAISSIVREFVDQKATIFDAARNSWIEQGVRGLDQEWNKKLLGQVRLVTKENVRHAMRDVVQKVFEPGAADIVVTCSSVMVDDLVKNFKDAGFDPQVKKLEDFQEGYGLEAPEDGGDDTTTDDDHDGEDEDEDSEGEDDSMEE